MTIENECELAAIQFAMQIGDDDDRKFEAFRLMNCHQADDVGRFIHLAFAFASADGFKLFDVMNKVADQMAGLLELFRQPKKLLDVRYPLRAVKIRRDNREKLRRSNR